MLAPSYNKTTWEAIEQYDPALELVWDSKDNRWDIYRQGPSKRVWVFRIENDDKSYRPLDNRVLHFLVNSDGYKYKDAKTIHREMLEYERECKARADGSKTDYMEQVARYHHKRIVREMA